ncbi:type III pantothenate kinase [Ferruginibacter sp. HRS2-29]|uniref:type III pantothenate kinase n=1 Tax=Ferruginibacter sp. HRS2-29 TaxID=2487334 RepID=UPI0020CE0084|nr:type III pantothenate kinase [Ferruginibacter sp. HRS2-29]MCP9750137.1 type III pantothenate kinase [Ferruginibacter sp. HRS2-29]
MTTTICFDFGNTRLKAAIFADGEFTEEIFFENDSEAEINAALEKFQPQRSILSSVIDHNPALETLLAEKTAFHKLSAATRINFSTAAVGKPETIGADRLALCAAAVHFYPGKNNLVIGLGSCITYNFINQYHQFLGGGISPGMDMRFRSMHDYTAKLPLITASWNFPLIGYDTRTNMLSGVINGMTSEIDGIIEKYDAKYGNFNVVLTGGNSAYFASQLKKKIFADHNFLFKGLYALSELNNCPT